MTDEELDLLYLRSCLGRATLVPFVWEGEDKNLLAFTSKERLVEWYSQPPGHEGEPYRDRGFYCRELAHLSRVLRPKTVVEFGTSLGIGTCLLHWLNLQAKITTVDINTETFLPGDQRVRMGHLARLQGIPCQFILGDAGQYAAVGVNLCLVDADHSYEAVRADSWRAWLNRAYQDRWAIVWHDHNDRHPGVVHAVAEFCAKAGVTLNSRPDSDTVWVMGKG